MQPGPANRRALRGFTLLEILVATAVGAVVLLVINATFFGALRLRNTTHERIDSDLAVQRTLGIVRRDLAGLMLPGGPFSGQLQTTPSTATSPSTSTPTLAIPEFAGERVSPDIYTNSGRVDGWNPFSEVQVVAYYLTPATDGTNSKSLVRVVTRNLLPVQQAISEPQTLLPGIAEAAVEFYDGTAWTSEWDSTVTSTLPAAIKFRLVFANGGSIQNPSAPVELVVPILVTTTTSQTQAAEDAAAL